MTLRVAFVALAALALLSPPASAGKLTVKKGQSIQSVIDAASAGDTVVVPKGVYVEVLLVPESKPGLRLFGKGAVIEARPAGASGSGAGISVAANDVELRGFEIRHARNGGNPVGGSSAGWGVVAQGARIRISQLVVRSCSDGGVQVEGPDALVEQVLVERVDGDGVYVSGAGALVRKVTVERAAGWGVIAAGNDALVSQCRVAHSVLGILAQGDSGVEVSNCQVDHVREYALRSDHGGVVRFVKNKVSDAGFGMYVSGQTVHVEGNRLEDLQSAGLVASGTSVTVTGNVVNRLGFGEAGCQVLGSSVLVTGNTFTDLGAEGLVVQADSGEVSGNRVQRCGIVGDGAAMLLGGEGLQVAKNKVLDSFGVAVFLDIDDGLFENNTIQGGRSTGLHIDSSAEQLTLRNNKVSNVLGEGIQNFGDATALEGNKVGKARTPITNDTDGGATLVDLGGNKFGKGASAASAPQPELVD